MLPRKGTCTQKCAFHTINHQSLALHFFNCHIHTSILKKLHSQLSPLAQLHTTFFLKLTTAYFNHRSDIFLYSHSLLNLLNLNKQTKKTKEFSEHHSLFWQVFLKEKGEPAKIGCQSWLVALVEIFVRSVGS